MMLTTLDMGKSLVCSLNIEWFIRDVLFDNRISPEYRRQPSLFFRKDAFNHRFLSHGELQTLNRYKVLKKQVEWLAGRFLAKWMIHTLADPLGMSQLGRVPLHCIALDYTSHGAPFIVGKRTWGISISHSGNYAVVALRSDASSTYDALEHPPMGPREDRTGDISVSGEMKIGVDIERIGTVPDANFMKTAFSPYELPRIPNDAREIYRRWTVKEAFLKYIGMGFNESLHCVEVLGDMIRYGGKPVDGIELTSRFVHDTYVISLIEPV